MTHWILQNPYTDKLRVTRSTDKRSLVISWTASLPTTTPSTYCLTTPLPPVVREATVTTPTHTGPELIVLSVPTPLHTPIDQHSYTTLIQRTRARLNGQTHRTPKTTSEITRTGTGYRVRLIQDAISSDRTRLGYKTTAIANPHLTLQPAILGLSVGKSHEVTITLPLHVGVTIKSGSTNFTLIAENPQALGDARYLLHHAKPRNAFTGVGVLEAGKVYPKTKTTKRGSKK